MLRQKYLAVNFTGHVPAFAQTVPGAFLLHLRCPPQEHMYTHLHQMTGRYSSATVLLPEILQCAARRFWFVWTVVFVLFYLKTLTWSFGGFFCLFIKNKKAAFPSFTVIKSLSIP